ASRRARAGTLKVEPADPPQHATALILVVVLALALAVGAGVLWRMWQQLDAATAAKAELDHRYAELSTADRELRGRYRGQSTTQPGDPAPDRAGSAEKVLFSKEIESQPGSAELDEPLRINIDSAIVDLSRALRQVPDHEDWLVVVDGYAATAAADGAVAVQ